MTGSDSADARQIRAVVDDWAIARDSGYWDRLRAAYHPDGRMVATWFEGTVDRFVTQCMAGWDKGSNSQHVLGGFTVDIAGDHAIAQTRVVLSARGLVENVECDITCTGRFYDFFERRAGGWAIARRQLTYEKDRLDPVDPAATLRLDPEILARFPVGYRHLAYLQTKTGLSVFTDLPGLRGPEVDALYSRGRAWLAGGAVP